MGGAAPVFAVLEVVILEITGIGAATPALRRFQPGHLPRRRHPSSDCLDCQVIWHLQGWLFLSMLLRMISSLRMQAMRATIFFLPCVSRCW